jgi:hypothetical protein
MWSGHIRSREDHALLLGKDLCKDVVNQGTLGYSRSPKLVNSGSRMTHEPKAEVGTSTESGQPASPMGTSVGAVGRGALGRGCGTFP